MRPQPDAPPVGRGTEVTTSGGVQVITSPDGRTTTINDHGRVTMLTTSPDGLATVTVNGRRTTDARALNDAITRVATSARPGRETSVRLNGRPLSQDDLLAGSALAGGAAAFVALVTLYAVGRFLLRLVRRRPAAAVPNGSPSVAPRIDRLEQAIESIAVEVERVAEAQRFSAKLLAERLPAPPAAGRPTPERVITPH